MIRILILLSISFATGEMMTRKYKAVEVEPDSFVTESLGDTTKGWVLDRKANTVVYVGTCFSRRILLPAIIYNLSTVSSLQSYYWQPEGFLTQC